jgi:hypothetical protein
MNPVSRPPAVTAAARPRPARPGACAARALDPGPPNARGCSAVFEASPVSIDKQQNQNKMVKGLKVKYKEIINIGKQNRILYEIKPKSYVEFCINKENAANEWCKINGFSFIYIDEDWLIKNYSDELIKNQPEYNKISSRIKKSLKRY